jgi:threonine dehydratase
MMELSKKIELAQNRLVKVIRRTPMVYSDTISKLTGHEVFLKLENLQKAGSFKIRGAYSKMSQLSPVQRKSGVVAASAGNLAQGVALAASLLGIHSTIVMPEASSIAKQEATRAYGGEVILFGSDVNEALDHARELEKRGKIFVHPFDDEEIIAGQGTIGLEILQDVPEVETIIVPIGGGGLISGISAIVKKKRPLIRIIGVESAYAPSAVASLKRKKIVEVKIRPTLADGIALRKVGELTFPIMQKNVDQIVTVQENQIASAILMLMERKRVVAEGAGATPLAALLSGRPKIRGKRIVLVVSGGNIDFNLLDRIIEKGLAQTGRVVRFEVLLKDIPGALAKIADLVGQYGANILHIIHERAARDIPIGSSRVILVLETRNRNHIQEIKKGLREQNYAMKILA